MNPRILSFLKGVPLTVYLVAGALTLAGSWLALNNAHQRSLGAERVLTAQAVHQRDSLAKALKAKSTQFQKDTVRIVRSIATVDTLIQHRIDTAVVHQTDTVKITVAEAKAVQDTLRACRSVVRDCASIQADLRGMLKADTAIIRNLERRVPSPAKPWVDRLVGFGLGFASGYVAKH